MKFNINEETKRVTRKCVKGFSCLSAERNELCRVISCYDNDIHFIYCATDILCSYKNNIGGRDYCECPIRMNIYDEYGI
jgi:hypothetical protein